VPRSSGSQVDPVAIAGSSGIRSDRRTSYESTRTDRLRLPAAAGGRRRFPHSLHHRIVAEVGPCVVHVEQGHVHRAGFRRGTRCLRRSGPEKNGEGRRFIRQYGIPCSVSESRSPRRSAGCGALVDLELAGRSGAVLEYFGHVVRILPRPEFIQHVVTNSSSSRAAPRWGPQPASRSRSGARRSPSRRPVLVLVDQRPAVEPPPHV